MHITGPSNLTAIERRQGEMATTYKGNWAASLVKRNGSDDLHQQPNICRKKLGSDQHNNDDNDPAVENDTSSSNIFDHFTWSTLSALEQPPATTTTTTRQTNTSNNVSSGSSVSSKTSESSNTSSIELSEKELHRIASIARIFPAQQPTTCGTTIARRTTTSSVLERKPDTDQRYVSSTSRVPSQMVTARGGRGRRSVKSKSPKRSPQIKKRRPSDIKLCSLY